MDDELYTLLYAVAHGYIRKPEQVLAILRESGAALDLEYINKCIDLLKFAKGAFLEDWPESGVHPLEKKDAKAYPDRAKA